MSRPVVSRASPETNSRPLAPNTAQLMSDSGEPERSGEAGRGCFGLTMRFTFSAFSVTRAASLRTTRKRVPMSHVVAVTARADSAGYGNRG